MTTASGKPLILRAPEVRSLLENGEAEVVRPIKQARDGDEVANFVCPASESGWIAWFGLPMRDAAGVTRKAYKFGFRCPFGAVGSEHWCREAWGWSAQLPMSGHYDDCTRSAYPALFAYRADSPDGNWCWRSSAAMPKWASRLTVTILSVAVENREGQWVWVAKLERKESRWT